MNPNLILRTITTPYGDTTLNSVLSHSNLDNNFIGLKSNLIYTATTDNGVLTLNKINGETIDITLNGLEDIYISAMTFNVGNYDLTLDRNDGVSFTESLSILATDMTVTGGTYNINTGVVTLTNNSGGTFNITGFVSGFTDFFTTGGTFNNNSGTLSLNRNDGNSVLITGFTDVRITGGTYSAGTSIFTNNTGGTFNVTGFTTNQNLQQVTDVGNTTTNGIVIYDNNQLPIKSFKIETTGFSQNVFSELSTAGLSIGNGGQYSIIANGVVSLTDLNGFSGNTNVLQMFNDTTNYGVGFTLAAAGILNNVSLDFHPDYFTTQTPYSSPVKFYIPYKPENTTVSLATLDDISGFTLDLSGNTLFYRLPIITGSTGEIAYFGSGSSLNAGLIYYLNSSGVWTLTNATTSASSKYLLGIALGTSITNGMLIRGYAHYSIYSNIGIGEVLYLGTTNGFFQSTPPSNSNEVVRIIGYCIDSSNPTIYFNPDNTWVEIV